MTAAELQMPHQPSSRNTPTRYRKETERVKSTIALTGKDLISLQETIKLRNNQFAAASLSGQALAVAVMQQMTYAQVSLSLNVIQKRLVQPDTFNDDGYHFARVATRPWIK